MWWLPEVMYCCGLCETSIATFAHCLGTNACCTLWPACLALNNVCLSPPWYLNFHYFWHIMSACSCSFGLNTSLSVHTSSMQGGRDKFLCFLSSWSRSGHFSFSAACSSYCQPASATALNCSIACVLNRLQQWCCKCRAVKVVSHTYMHGCIWMHACDHWIIMTRHYYLSVHAWSLFQSQYTNHA